MTPYCRITQTVGFTKGPSSLAGRAIRLPEDRLATSRQSRTATTRNLHRASVSPGLPVINGLYARVTAFLTRHAMRKITPTARSASASIPTTMVTGGTPLEALHGNWQSGPPLALSSFLLYKLFRQKSLTSAT